MTYNPGGMEAYIMSLYRAADKSRIAFDFVTDFDRIAYADEIEQGGSKVYFIPAKSKNPFGHLSAFKKLLREHPEYDVIYFNILNSGAAFTMSVAKKLGRKCYVHSHASCADNARLHKFFQKKLCKYADKRLACSDSAAVYMFGTTENCHIINNAIDISKFLYSETVRSKKREELSIDRGAFVVFHAGRLSYEKNPLFLIDIFCEVLKEQSNAVLVHAGTGIMADEVKAYAEEKGIADKVKFLGVRSDVNELYSAADVFVLPSLHEGLPMVLVEAQAASLPCISSTNASEASKITDLLTFLKLEEGSAVWAEEICKKAGYARKDMLEEISNAGFSINSVIDKTVDILIN